MWRLLQTLWRTRIGADPNIAGTVSIERQARTIVGVLPRDFELTPRGTPKLWVPIHRPEIRYRRSLRWLSRLRRGTGIFAGFKFAPKCRASRALQQYPNENRATFFVMELSHKNRGKVRPILLILLGQWIRC